MKQSKKINIVCASDNNYAQHLGVMLYSLFRSATKPADFDVYIIYRDFDKHNKEKITNIFFEFGIKPNFIRTDGTDFDNLIISHHISSAAYYRINIPRLLNKLDKVIYLDCDLIIKDDIRKLWDVDLGDNFLAAVEDPLFNRHEELGIPRNFIYFNSGVMLVDAYKWRSSNISEKVLSFLEKKNELICLWDQDGLNGILYDKWKHLDPKWNQQRIFFNLDYKRTSFSKEKFDESISNPSIVHFTGSTKPWQYVDRHPFQKDYYEYLALTPWRDYIPNDRTKWNIFKKFVKKIIWR